MTYDVVYREYQNSQKLTQVQNSGLIFYFAFPVKRGGIFKRWGLEYSQNIFELDNALFGYQESNISLKTLKMAARADLAAVF